MHPILNDLTVVIPTYNRQPFVIRQIEYWRNSSVQVLILDGSEDPIDFKDEPSKNILYIHAPVSIEKRFSLAATLIKTKYATLLSDDEFFLKSGLISCLSFLNENEDYVACKGVALGFNFIKRSVSGYSVYPTMRSKNSLIHPNPLHRMIGHMNPYEMTTLWAVTRSEIIKKTLLAMGADGPFSSAGVGEIQTGLLTAYYGKCKIIDQLVWLRSFENQNIWWNFGRISVLDWYSAEIFSQEVSRFYIAMQEQICCDEKQRFVDFAKESMMAYVRYCQNVNSQKRTKKLKNFIGRRYAQVLRLWYLMKCRLYRKKPDSLLIASSNKMASSGILLDVDELSHLEAIIIKFHTSGQQIH